MKNKRGKRNLAKTALVFMLALCVFISGAFVDGEVFAASEFQTSSPFSNADYSSYYHNGRFTNNLIVNGVDISEWQSKNCRFNDAKAAGVDFAIMRVTWTSYGRSALTLHNDDNFYSQYLNAKNNGVMTGVYVFSQAKNATEGAQEATYAINRLRALGIGPKDLQLPVYMDYEFAGGVLGRMHGISRTAATNAAVAFCNTIKAAGYTPGIYANTSFFGSYIVASQFAPDVDFWCAQYYKRNQSAVNYTKWQYSSSARIDGLLFYTGFQGNIDADFWYIDKKAAAGSVAKICGRTVLSVKDAKNPKFKIYAGGKLLEEGVDYNVGGIRNNAKGKGYAYIKGIGKFGGYALVPLKITSKSAGSVNKNLKSVAANHLTYASAQRSKYVKVTTLQYKKGNTYTVQTALNMRKGAGTEYAQVKRSSLNATMKKKTYSGTYAVLKEGAKVKCKKVKGDWMKISGGWICCGEGGEAYVR